jgi:hypothetical protein
MGKKDSLHALVLEGERSEKSFPYLLSAQKLGRAVLVKNGVGVGELGPHETKGGGKSSAWMPCPAPTQPTWPDKRQG